MAEKTVEKLDRVVVRFAGDSGDGMQLTGSRFTDATAVVGNDLATLPDFPAEIRAPAGTPHGVSAFQIHFASRDILTPGDHPNVLVAMNPAALITQLAAVEKGGTVIVNEDGFTDHNLRKAGYPSNPLDDDTLDDFQVFRVPMTSMTVRATEDIEGISSRDAARSKNLFALGLVSWMYGRPTTPTVDWVEKKFADRPEVKAANLAAFRAGYNFGETAELLAVHYEVDPAPGAARHLPERERHAGAGLWADRRERAVRPPALPRELSDHPGVRAPARALAPPALRRAHDPGRGRDRGREHGARSRVLGSPRRHGHERPGHGPQGRDDRPRGRDGAAPRGGRHPARRPLDRHADQDRGRRPADGPLRAPRRVAAAGDRRLHAGRLLRRRDRGRPHRGHPPHAGDPAGRHLPGELLRALAAPRRELAARDRPRLRRPRRTTATPSCPTCATTIWRAPGRSPARPGCGTGSAASRRRSAPATSPTSPRTTST